jgi:hypothetical protein
MMRVLWALTRGYRLRPWASPYLRWRIETYWGMRAGEISFTDFWKFAWTHRKELLRYLRWAAHVGQASMPVPRARPAGRPVLPPS